jgi:hypothetical protein
VSGAKWKWPWPSDEESVGAHVKALIQPRRLDLEYEKIVSRAVSDVGLFAEYLHCILIGSRHADLLAPHRDIQIELFVPKSEVVIASLPWELAKDPVRGFLSGQKRFAFSRVVKSTSAKSYSIGTMPRVLFVVGADVFDPKIKPGAEYLCILRAVRGLRTHLLLDATPERLGALVRQIRPAVVHFVGHGIRVPPSIELKDDTGSPVGLSPSALLQRLTLSDGLPPVVVLNACHSAGVQESVLADGAFASSFALELVAEGVGTVVAMGGEVQDQASRLFARRLYESLADGSDWIAAASHGRRFGLAQVTRGGTVGAVDWALPTTFRSELGSAPPDPVPPDRVRWRAAVDTIVRPVSYPPFCGRWSLLAGFDQLLSGIDARSNPSPREIRCVVVETKAGEPRAGKGRALQQLELHALRDGHFAVRVDCDQLQYETTPGSLLAKLWVRVQKRVDSIAAALGINSPAATGDQPQSIHEWLVAMLEVVDAAYPSGPSPRYCVLILDNAHCLGTDLRVFLSDYLTAGRLLSRNGRVRVAFSFGHAIGRETQETALKDWRDDHNLTADFVLTGVLDPKEVDLVYDQFLFRWSREVPGGNRTWRPLIAAPEQRGAVRVALDEQVERRLSHFEDRKDRIDVMVSTAVRFDILREANDEEIVRSWDQEQ